MNQLPSDPARSLFMNSEINESATLGLISSMAKLHLADPNSPITLFICSDGGSITDAFGFYDYVTDILKPKLITVALGDVASMAVILFMAGEHRFMGKRSQLRFHNFYSSISNRKLTAAEAIQLGNQLNYQEGQYTDIILRHAVPGKLDAEAVKGLLKNSIDVTPKLALKLGLAHRII